MLKDLTKVAMLPMPIFTQMTSFAAVYVSYLFPRT